MIIFRYLVTTALPYVNNVPHLGTLLGSGLCADVYARFLRLNGEDCIYIGGADEYGTPIAVAAQKEGTTPQKLADKYYKLQINIFKKFNISFDKYTRTTSKEHTKIVQDFYYNVKQNNFIYFKEIEQLYCNKCEHFLPDRYVEGICYHCGAEEARGDQCDACGKLIDPLLLKEPYCVTCKSTPVVKKTKHAFFELSKLSENLKEWIEEQDTWTENAKSTALGWLKNGLEDRCITRDIKWGVPNLDLDGKVFYVWFDAPIGYITGAKQRGRDSWWHDKNTKLVQFMGKDNIPFHTWFFPGMLMAEGSFILPTTIWANEYINYEGGKFSKSQNRGINLDDALKILPADYWRYYLLVQLPEKRDTDFTWKDFQEKINSDLNDAIGNFVHRTLKLTDKFFDGKIPEGRDEKLLEQANEITNKTQTSLKKIHLKESVKQVVSIARLGNEYLSREEPWKNDNKEKVLGTCLQLCKVLSVYLEPFIPETSDKIKNYLNIKNINFENAYEPLTGSINDYDVLFRKIEDKEVEEWRNKFECKKKVNYVEYEDFEKLDMRVAEVLEAEEVEKSDKLLKLKVNDGENERTIMAGISKYYSPEDLKGKKLLVLVNLEPRKIMGVESQGMVLCTEKGNEVKVNFTDAEVGAKIC